MTRNKKIRIYLDNSFAGKLFNPIYPNIESKFREILNKIIEKINNNEVEIIKSSVFKEEHDKAPKDVQESINQQLSKTNPISITNTEEETDKINKLIEKYKENKLLPNPKHDSDKEHVATAIVHECDIILTANMKHIGNHVQDFNKIHQDSGYNPIPIPRPENFLKILEELINSKKENLQQPILAPMTPLEIKFTENINLLYDLIHTNNKTNSILNSISKSINLHNKLVKKLNESNNEGSGIPVNTWTKIEKIQEKIKELEKELNKGLPN